MDEFYPVYGLPYTGEPIELPQIFGERAAQPLIVEIGFGMGTATAQIAQARPDDNFIGIEVHSPGVGSLLNIIASQQIPNLRVIRHDAVEVLENMIPAQSLAGIHVYFPDPWHKARHHKRRLIQAPFVKQLAERLRPGGYLHLATDWENYAEQMLAVLSAEPLLQNTVAGYAPKPDYRPTTKFETRGLKLGHGVWDLVFTRK
jgi:tRNA (guanine-N7-)-methyltransferase